MINIFLAFFWQLDLRIFFVQSSFRGVCVLGWNGVIPVVLVFIFFLYSSCSNSEAPPLVGSWAFPCFAVKSGIQISEFPLSFSWSWGFFQWLLFHLGVLWCGFRLSGWVLFRCCRRGGFLIHCLRIWAIFYRFVIVANFKFYWGFEPRVLKSVIF